VYYPRRSPTSKISKKEKKEQRVNNDNSGECRLEPSIDFRSLSGTWPAGALGFQALHIDFYTRNDLSLAFEQQVTASL
jgi:hypothetical protein